MNEIALMKGFPPAEEGQVTLGNWRKPPFNRWSFQHVREIVPSAEIANDPAHVRPLASDPQDFSAVTIEDDEGSLSFASFLEKTDTDGLVVLHNGKIVFEHYANGMQPSTQHIMMSVSKSVLGVLAGILVERGVLDLSVPVTDWIPEVAGTAYAGATLRDLMDMRVGILFDEDYMASAGPIIEYRKAQGWDPLEPGDEPMDLRSFYASLTEGDGEHGGRFHYVSPNTDLMGWVIERAADKRYADLVSDHIWRPIGAERGAYITVDRLGAPRCAGGYCATVRDLARLGLVLAEGGKYGQRQVIPASWIEDVATAGDTEAWDTGDFAKYFPGIPAHYRSKWYVIRGDTPLVFALGVFGQNLFVDPANAIVIAKCSSQALPMDEKRIALTTRGVQGIRRHLAG